MACHTLKRLLSQGEREKLIGLGNEENHLVLHPSHTLQKDGEVVGYCGIGSLPLVMSFFSQRLCKARDSIAFISQCETHLRAMGHDHYFTTCSETSPFWSHMSKLGYRDLGTTHLLVKDL